MNFLTDISQGFWWNLMNENFGTILEKHLYRSSVYIKVAGFKPASLLKMNFFTDSFQWFCWRFISWMKILAKCSKPTSETQALNKVIEPFKFGICISGCCNVLACVVSYMSFIKLKHVRILFFMNLRMHWFIYRQAWVITWGEMARPAELVRFSKTSQHG